MSAKPEELDTIRHKIEALDLDPIKVKLMEADGGGGWTLEYTEEVERWYRRFLLLTVKHPNKSIVVTQPIDTFWHHHILDTRKYAEDCEACFGYFLHHFPYFGMRGEDDARNLERAFEDTLQIIEAEFGESLLDAPISRSKGARLPIGGEEASFAGSKCSDCAGIAFAEGGGASTGLDLTRPTLR